MGAVSPRKSFDIEYSPPHLKTRFLTWILLSLVCSTFPPWEHTLFEPYLYSRSYTIQGYYIVILLLYAFILLQISVRPDSISPLLLSSANSASDGDSSTCLLLGLELSAVSLLAPLFAELLL